MKKKILVSLLLVVVVAVSLYFYAYKGHRDIATEKADFTTTVSVLQKEFAANDSLAYAKYQDKTIQIAGKLSTIDVKNRTIVMDGKLSASFLKTLPSGLLVGNPIKIKGRFLGYDDLLEEFKMDQTIVVE